MENYCPSLGLRMPTCKMGLPSCPGHLAGLERVGDGAGVGCYYDGLSHIQVAQWIKNLPAMQETQEMWVLSLGWEDPLEKGTTTH